MPTTKWNRRSFLQVSAGVVGTALWGGVDSAAAGASTSGGGGGGAVGDLRAWPEADRIIGRIKAPTFANRNFPITHYGAVGDGRSLCTTSIADAIAACAKSGGGHVVVPAGTFLTGAITLLSNVDLHLESGATLKFSTDPAHYPLVYTRWGGIECYNYSPFIYAFGQKNIGVTGSGTIDGQASDKYWWPWAGEGIYGWKLGGPTEANDSALLEQMGQTGVPVAKRIFGPGHYLPPSFVQPYRSKNVVTKASG
jgi:polygalacturonase